VYACIGGGQCVCMCVKGRGECVCMCVVEGDSVCVCVFVCV